LKLRRRQQYFDVARERATEATLLHREARFPLSMYVAGVAAESMLRAFHVDGATFDDRHDVAALLRAADLPEMTNEARRRLHENVVVVRIYWRNVFRFASEDVLRAYLRSIDLDDRAGGVGRGSDFLKVRSRELLDAALSIVELGGKKWKP
jgi:hypothetical protein